MVTGESGEELRRLLDGLGWGSRGDSVTRNESPNAAEGTTLELVPKDMSKERFHQRFILQTSEDNRSGIDLCETMGDDIIELPLINPGMSHLGKGVMYFFTDYRERKAALNAIDISQLLRVIFSKVGAIEAATGGDVTLYGLPYLRRFMTHDGRFLDLLNAGSYHTLGESDINGKRHFHKNIRDLIVRNPLEYLIGAGIDPRVR